MGSEYRPNIFDPERTPTCHVLYVLPVQRDSLELSVRNMLVSTLHLQSRIKCNGLADPKLGKKGLESKGIERLYTQKQGDPFHTRRRCSRLRVSE